MLKEETTTELCEVKLLPAFGVPIVTRGRAIPSHPSTSTDVAVEYSSEGPTHIRDLKCTEVKDDECTNVHVVMKIMHFQERHSVPPIPDRIDQQLDNEVIETSDLLMTDQHKGKT